MLRVLRLLPMTRGDVIARSEATWQSRVPKVYWERKTEIATGHLRGSRNDETVGNPKPEIAQTSARPRKAAPKKSLAIIKSLLSIYIPMREIDIHLIFQKLCQFTCNIDRSVFTSRTSYRDIEDILCLFRIVIYYKF